MQVRKRGKDIVQAIAFIKNILTEKQITRLLNVLCDKNPLFGLYIRTTACLLFFGRILNIHNSYLTI